MAKRLENGDRVRYSARFLRNIGDYSADSAERVGVVLENRGPAGGQGPDYIKLSWDDSDKVAGCLACNVERVKP